MTDSHIIDLFGLEDTSSEHVPLNEPTPVLTSEVTGDEFDLAGELESLRLLEAQAAMLQAQIKGKKQVISPHIRDYRDNLCLKHLIRECDGVVCAARVIVQKICDKVGIETDPTFGYAKMKNPHVRQMLVLNDQQRQNLHLGATMSGKYHIPVQLPTTSALDFDQKSTVSLHNFTQQNTVVKVLSIIATALGITSLVLFIRKRCMSMRKRVEHAADVEERRNARAYRRAARRAEMRKRWSNFLGAFNCFRSTPALSRVEDYEEKRALILQDAFLEQGADQAEKGEIMEAEIRELRYAQEIVSSLVRVDEHRYEIVSHRYDPPPPLVPLPPARSRASTGTLPSYWSESLPDYTSRADGESTPSHSSDEELGSNQASAESAQVSERSSNTRYTPTSSLRETSPRVSAETLRTRQSREKDS